MRKIAVLLFILSCLLSGQVHAFSHGTASITKNIITDYHATCNGTNAGNADADYTAFNAFKADYTGNTNNVTLVIPNGSTCCFSDPGQNPYYVFKGILNLTVAGTGATLTDQCSGNIGGYALGGGGGIAVAPAYGLVQSVSSGANCATLVTLADFSKYAVNNYAVLSDIDLQGYGQPPNLGEFEYVKVSSINPNTGVVCFTGNIAHNYFSTYPNYNAGTIGLEPYSGGPATIYPLPTSWGVTHVYNNLTYITNGAQLLANGYSITFNGGNATQTAGMIPSQNHDWTAANVVCSGCAIEADKLVEIMNVVGGTWSSFAFQSSSVHTGNFTNVSPATGFNGTPRVLNVTGGTIPNLGFGPFGYGAATQANLTNVVVTNTPVISAYKTSVSLYTVSSGSILFPVSSHAVPWCIPGTKAHFVGQFDFETDFSITGVSISGGNTACATSLSGNSFPTLPGTLFIQPDPGANINFSGVTGNTAVIDMSQACARNAPIYTCSNRIYTCTNGIAAVQAANPGVPVLNLNSPGVGPEIWGTLTSLTANVTQADTSGSSPVFHLSGQADNYPTLNAAGSLVSWGPTLNLKVAGLRSYSGSGGSWTGTQTGDSLTTLAANPTMTQGMPVYTNIDVTGESAVACPIVTVTLQTSR